MMIDAKIEKSKYFELRKIGSIPRLPLEGSLDLTYRCNNSCRHCWLKAPAQAQEEELSFKEVKHIVNEAKRMGCREWHISGGEPMFRADFCEIFDYITTNSMSYSLNTNGTLITHKIARLLRKRGVKMVALYGATSQVHDHITRSPGSFEATMRGLAYLKEAGASFTVQLIPLRDNHHQFKKMLSLAKSLSSTYRIGAPWLYLSSSGDREINNEIIGQRLAPKEAVELDKPDLSFEESLAKKDNQSGCGLDSDDSLFVRCISKGGKFHIDPYGQMSFCCFVKDPALSYDLKKGDFKECWDKFLPSLIGKIKGGKEYFENCASCKLRKDCRWCPVYGYLEHRRYGAKVEYLCEVARESEKFKQNWKRLNRRYYSIADLSIQVDSDLPITDFVFHPKFKQFEVEGPGEDVITIRHHFSLPDLNGRELGREVYRKPPWAIYKKQDFWVYLDIASGQDNSIYRLAVFSHDHARAAIYNYREEDFLKGGLNSLTLFPTDQILLARLLADREGCCLHSSGVRMNDKGLLFAGHSGAGKSTIVKMLKDRAEILCDDCIIVRMRPEGFKIFGTWNHGEVSDVSSNSAILKAILFLEKSTENRLVAINDRKEMIGRLMGCLIRPFVTADWWKKMFFLVDKMIKEVPIYILYFDKSGKIVDLLERL